jgi:hypothetical protein
MGWNGSYGQLPDQGIIKFFAGPYSVITIADRCRVREPKIFGAEPTLVIRTALTLLVFGWKSWVGVAPTPFFL